jgi:hypothetical protein
MNHFLGVAAVPAAGSIVSLLGPLTSDHTPAENQSLAFVFEISVKQLYRFEAESTPEP